MKTIWTIFFGLFLTVNFTIAQDTLYVYQGGAVLYKRIISAVDSVTFKKVYTVTDKDGNVYPTVTIGTQTWMASNLKVTHYRDGSSIANVIDDHAWTVLTTGAWCDYSNLATNGTKYGHLYNWYAVSDVRKIAPVGWHIPTDAEWTTLTNYISAHLGASLSLAKALASTTTDWRTNSTTGTVGCDPILNNSSGFSALPSGTRTNGPFIYIGSRAAWWSSSSADATFASVRRIDNDETTLNLQTANYKFGGLSVRCIKD
jgi:uncharacterized protein (TIGR02145 family)